MRNCWWGAAWLLLVFSVHFSSQKRRKNVGAFEVAWVFTLPWELGNTLRAPLGAPLSLILTAGLAVILLFGMAVSPVCYFFGTPDRKYHLEDAIRKNSVLEKAVINATKFGNFAEDTRNIGTVTQEERISTYPSFMESSFWLVGNEDPTCQKLMVCHAHGFLNFISKAYLKYYRIFS